jgi:beta-glucosidase
MMKILITVCLILLQVTVSLPQTTVRTKRDIYRSGWIDFNKNGRKDPYEDASARAVERVEDLLARMTLEEKTNQLATLYGFGRVLRDELPTAEWKIKIWKDGIGNIDEHLNGVAYHPAARTQYSYPYAKHAEAINSVQRWFIEETRLGIPVDFTNEGLHGLCHDRATAFPGQINTGSAWDKELIRRIGRITGREARALGYTNIYSPILDIARPALGAHRRGLRGRPVSCLGSRQGDGRGTTGRKRRLHPQAFRRLQRAEGRARRRSAHRSAHRFPRDARVIPRSVSRGRA